MKVFRKESRSAAETKKVARELAKKLSRGDVVTLSGELGAGKTTFAKGLVKGLGARSERDVSSPTFVLIHEYRARLPVYHLDWYRLERVVGTDRELAEECFDANGVTLIEWPERGKTVLPRERLEVKLSHRGGSRRKVEIRPVGKKYERLWG